MRVLNRAFDNPLEKNSEKAVMPMAGGIMQYGYQCGMIWGAALAAGAQAHRLLGPGPQAETMAVLAAKKLVEAFRSQNGNINCSDITDLEKLPSTMQVINKFFIKGGAIGCFRMAARYAPLAFSEIEAALSERHVEAPSPPVSCTAMLARQMGVSDLHAVMAAGMAGGIGLCGGACGALGAAIWIMGMNSSGEGAEIDFKSPRALAVIDRFLKSTNFEFECSEITGQKFENIGDHAAYLRGGGCSQVIEALTAE